MLGYAFVNSMFSPTLAIFLLGCTSFFIDTIKILNSLCFIKSVETALPQPLGCQCQETTD